MFKNLNELRNWHVTQVAKYSRLSEINRSAASDDRNASIAKKLNKCAHNQDAIVAVHDAAARTLADIDDQLLDLLPKTAQLMDPPDGGSVTPIEQLRRYIDYLQNANEMNSERITLLTNVPNEWVTEFNAKNPPGTLAILLDGIQPNSMVDEIINFGDSESTGPTERQVYKWFQESTIAHHIEEDGHHISKRAMFIANKAWECALQSKQSPVVSEGGNSDIDCGRAWDYFTSKFDLDSDEWIDTDAAQLFAAGYDAALSIPTKPATVIKEIPVNDPIFYFVAQHYPLTAQVVERIYRECFHHHEVREATNANS